MMRLTDQTVNLLSQALVLASDRYVDFAVESANLVGGERVSAQFLKQAVETRQISILLAGSGECAIEVSPEETATAKTDAERITMQLFADIAKEQQTHA